MPSETQAENRGHVSFTRRTVRDLASSLLACLLLASFGWTAVRLAENTGAFYLVWSDFGHYWAMWRATEREGPSRMYDLGVLQRHRRKLLNHYRGDRIAYPRVQECGTPYPPLYGRVFSPVARGKPHRMLVGWLAVQIGLAAWVAHRAAALLPQGMRILALGLTFSSYPVLVSHFAGQFQMFTVVFMTHCFLALRGGRDFVAGLWLGAVAMKPHYAVLLLGCLLWQRRFRALGGAVASGAAILLASWLAAGTDAMLAYPQLVLGIETCAPGDASVILGWRTLVSWIAPSLTLEDHFRVAGALGLVTVALALWAARGSWRFDGRRLPVAFTLLLLATLLSGYHIDGYGSAVLLVPLVAVLGGASGTPIMVLVALVLALGPSAWFLAHTYLDGFTDIDALVGANRLSTVCLVLLFLLLLKTARGMRDDDPGDAGAGPAATPPGTAAPDPAPAGLRGASAGG